LRLSFCEKPLPKGSGIFHIFHATDITAVFFTYHIPLIIPLFENSGMLDFKFKLSAKDEQRVDRPNVLLRQRF